MLATLPLYNTQRITEYWHDGIVVKRLTLINDLGIALYLFTPVFHSSNILVLPPALHTAFSIASMTVKDPGGRKFTQLVAHHVFGDEHGNELLAVMHRYGQTQKIRNNGGATRPGLDHAVIPVFLSSSNLPNQALINKRSLF